MIVLDTNVVSEMMRARPDERVLDWVAMQPHTLLHVTSVTQAEILHGVVLLPTGRKRSAIQAAASSGVPSPSSTRRSPQSRAPSRHPSPREMWRISRAAASS
jgi:predicted nucleic acid-binding protein